MENQDHAGAGQELRKRVLLVDDERTILRMFETALQRAGFEVDAVESGAGAKALLSLRRYDALLTDKNLPDLDGVALATLARASHLTLPIVMVTGYSTPELAQSLRNTVDVLFSKPVSLKTLVDGVHKAIEQRAGNGIVSRSAGEPPVVIVTADARLAFRVADSVRELGRLPEAVASVDDLARFHDISGLVLDARAVPAEGRRAVWRMLGRHRDLKVLVVGGDSSHAIGLGAAKHVAAESDDLTLRSGIQKVFLSASSSPLMAGAAVL